MIEAALRLTPGIIAIHCHMPIMKASKNDTCFSSRITGFLKALSIKTKTIPPANIVMATVKALSSKPSIFLENKNPTIKAGVTATASFA